MLWIKRLFIGSLLSVAGYGGYLLYTHPYFAVDTVRIEGGLFLTDAQKETHREACLGRPIWTTFSKRLSQSFLNHPEVEAVRIERMFPREVSVYLTDKDPLFGCLSAGKCFFISQDGTILNKQADVSLENSEAMIIFKGVDESALQERYMDQTHLAELKELLQLIDTHLQGIPVQAEYKGLLGWTLLLYDTIPVYLGQREQLADKFLQLRTFLTWYEGENKKQPIRYVDARIQDRVLVNYGK